MSRFGIGLTVLVLLMLLTLVEYQVAVSFDRNLFWLLPISVAKAGLILVYFMHVGDLFARSSDAEIEEGR